MPPPLKKKKKSSRLRWPNHIRHKCLGIWLLKELTPNWVLAMTGLIWMRKMMLNTKRHNATRSRSWNIELISCFSQRCHCALWNKILKFFNLPRTDWEICKALRLFRRMRSFYSKLEFTLEKRCAWKLLASRPVILKWKNSLPTDPVNEFLP